MLPASSVSILKRLSLTELKRFGDFVKSPYHNSTSSLEIIYDTVLKSYPDFNSKALLYENMAKKIFPTGKNKEKRIKNLYSEFGNLMRIFLGHEELNKSDYEMDVLIAQGLSNKSLFEDANKFINKSLEQNNNGLLTDSLKYNYTDRLNMQMLFNLSHLGEYFEEILEINEHVQETRIISFLRDIYSSGNMEKLTNDVFNVKSKKTINAALLEQININKFLSYLEKTHNKYHSYLKIIYLLYFYAVNEISKEQFIDLKNEVIETVPNVEKWEAYTILARFNEIILVRLVPLDTSYNVDVFELAKLFCELEIFPGHSKYPLPVGYFRDIFNTALNVREYDWAENFVNEYSQYLNEELIENELNYCKGVLNFKRGHYEKSLDFFSKVKPDYILVNINIRFYYIMNFIELKAFESARAAIHAFRQFYKDNEEIPKKSIATIPDSLKYFSEIVKCGEERKKFDEFLYKEVNDGRRFYHAIYIKNKIEKLKW